MTTHIPVLLKETVELLGVQKGSVVIDCTLGAGGHAEEILKKIAPEGALYGLDLDQRNLAIAQKKLTLYANVHLIQDTFQNLEEVGQKILAREKRIDAILFDLGLSSMHVDDAERGFSFQKEGPLDMRFNAAQRLTAADIINSYSLQDLLFIFKSYGEEPKAARIAQAIVTARRKQRFTSTKQLADFIALLFGRPDYFWKRHPATRIFQALRIATNDEIEALQTGLEAACRVLSPRGRIAVISYHSLEDRIVKVLFREKAREGSLHLLTKKPLTPSETEVKENPRSRSAKLRAAEKVF